MSRRFSWLGPAIFAITLTGPLYPQSAGFGGPVTGFVYNGASRIIRPLFGIPGAAYAGLSVMKEVDWASIAPDGTWAFITKSGSGTFVSGLPTLTPTAVAVSGLIEGVDHVAWSINGSYALVYASSANQLQRVVFSSDGASTDQPLSLSTWGQATTLAIDPTGKNIAFGIPGSGLYFFTVGSSPALISSMTQPVALAFDGAGQELYAADMGQQQVVEFNSSSGLQVFASLAQADGSVLSPVGLAVSGGGQYLLLADSAKQAVLVYGIASQNLANTIPLSFAPTRLDALSTAPSFILNGGNPKEWLLILDAAQNPAVYFVPASQEAR
jgi:DNA-binding beta-propeller fold protein YncE